VDETLAMLTTFLAFAITSASITTAPITYVNHEVGIDVRVGNAGTLHLLLDTGATLSITPDAAKRTGLSVRFPPGYSAYGSDGKPVPVGVAQISELDVGSIALHDQRAIVGNAPQGFDGAIGYPLFAAYRSLIDVRAKTLTLRPFDATPLASPTFPFTFVLGHLPAIHGTIGGVPASLGIDTGFGAAVTLNGTFAGAHGLLAIDAPPVPGFRDRGGALELVTIGPKTLTLDTLSLTPTTYVQVGSGFSGDSDGTIGMGLLEAFRIELDYAAHTIALHAYEG